MISTESTVLEACGGLIPDPRDLRVLLVHQQAKGLLGVKGIFVLIYDKTEKNIHIMSTVYINLMSFPFVQQPSHRR